MLFVMWQHIFVAGDFVISNFIFENYVRALLMSHLMNSTKISMYFQSRFGVCCLFLASNSGSVISQNCTYVRNPDFPGNYNGVGSVAYKLIKPIDGEYSIRC
jgi:hypothetical protein